MTPEERDRMDLDYLERLSRGEVAEPDMSPQAVIERLRLAGELCELSRIIRVPYIFYFQADYENRLGRDN